MPTDSTNEVLRRLADALDRDCGLPWPVSYLSYDLETTGFSREQDLIVEWGHALVQDGVVVDRNAILLNWLARPDLVPAAYVEGQLSRVGQAMRDDGRGWTLTPARLRSEGVDPHEVLEWVYNLLAAARDKGLVMVTHNGLNFDNQMLASHFAQDLQKEFEFDPRRVIDTGAVAKAIQLAARGDRDAYPRCGEHPGAYFKRITDVRAKGIFYSLDRYCLEFFGLIKLGADPAKMHSAGEDSYVLTLLMAEFGRRIAGTPATPGIVDNTAPVRPVSTAALPVRRSTQPLPNYRGQQGR